MYYTTVPSSWRRFIDWSRLIEKTVKENWASRFDVKVADQYADVINIRFYYIYYLYCLFLDKDRVIDWMDPLWRLQQNKHVLGDI